MAYSYKQNEEEARRRLRAFWAGSSLGRPALHVLARKEGFREQVWDSEGRARKKWDLIPDYYITGAQNKLEAYEFMAEAMPAVDLSWGADISLNALLAGGEYDYDGNGQAWVGERPELLDFPIASFDRSHPFVSGLEKCYEAVGKAIGGKAFINPPILLDALTTLSLLRTADRLCMDLYDQPDKVKEWCSAATTVFIDCYEHFYKKLNGMGYTETATWLNTMAEGRFEAVQCDFAVMLSPEMFGEFVLPDLSRTVEYLDFSLYHLDGTSQLRFLDQLRSMPRLSGIQWNPEPTAGPALEWVDTLRDILKRGFCLHISCDSVEEAAALTKELGPDGLMLNFNHPFDSVGEAEKAIEAIEKASK